MQLNSVLDGAEKLGRASSLAMVLGGFWPSLIKRDGRRVVGDINGKVNTICGDETALIVLILLQ
jgi:hypothetical protein